MNRSVNTQDSFSALEASVDAKVSKQKSQRKQKCQAGLRCPKLATGQCNLIHPWWEYREIVRKQALLLVKKDELINQLCLACGEHRGAPRRAPRGGSHGAPRGGAWRRRRKLQYAGKAIARPADEANTKPVETRKAWQEPKVVKA